MATISVIVPVYRVEPYICRCIDSIIAQTFTDFELILVDDGSPDKCPAICDEYAKQDNRIHVIHKQNGGLSSARNAGIDWIFGNSDSKWVTFIDSDDWVHNQMLEILLLANIKNQTNVSVAQLRRVGNVIVNDSLLDCKSTCVLAEQAWTLDFHEYCCGKLYNKELFNDIRFPVGKIHEDTYTTYKLIFKNECVSAVYLDLYYYYYNPEGITNNVDKKHLDIIEAYHQQLSYFSNRNLFVAYKQSCKDSIDCYAFTIEHLMNSKTHPDVLKQFRKHLKQAIKLHKKTLSLSPFDISCHFYYKMAYPKIMTLYIFVRYKFVLLLKKQLVLFAKMILSEENYNSLKRFLKK